MNIQNLSKRVAELESELAACREKMEAATAAQAFDLKERQSLQQELADTGQALKSSHARYRGLFDNAGEAIFIHDAAGTIIDVNQKALDLFGYSKTEFSLIRLSTLHPVQALERSKWAFETVMRKGKVTFEIEFMAKNGDIIPAEVTASIFESDGQQLIQGIVRDIRARLSLEQARRQTFQIEDTLAASEKTYREVFNGVTDGIFVHDIRTGAILDANRAILQMLACSHEEALGMSVGDFSQGEPPYAQADVLRSIQRSIVEGPQTFEWLAKRKSGELFWTEVNLKSAEIGGQSRILAVVRDITERKQAEERLQANERRFSQLIQNSFDTIVIMDAEGIQRYVSASAERVHGFSPAELVGIPVIEQMIHPADKEQVSAAFRHIIESGEGGAQYRHRHKEGGWVYLEARGINQLDNPEIKGVVVNVRDITGRKRAEEASEGNRRRFELALRGGRLGLWDWQTQTGAVTYSELWAEILGYALEEVEPTVGFFERHVHPEDRPAVLERLMGHIEGRFPAYHSEHRLRTKSGLWIWVMDRGEISERTTDGRPLRVTGVISDITARKQVEKALRESEQRLRLALRAANQGFYDLDLRTGDAVVSPEYATILGYDPAGFKETNDRWLERLHPDDRQRVEAVYTAYVAGKIPEYSVEFRQRTLEGGWKWILSQGRIVERAADGVPLRMMGTHTDIDERKRAEEQMRHVQKLESLGVLAGGIAHDFNNLLMSMLGNADLALHSMADAHPARDFVHNIVAASQRAAELCRQMLAYAGKGRFVLERLDFSQVVQEMAQILQVSVGKNVTLRYQLAAGLPHVEADASQVRQVVMNLITNASDAVGETPGIVTVVTGSMMCDREYLTGLFPDDELSEGRYVFLEVADTGVGMDEATRERIFDPFFTTKFIGRGLGLAAVLGIVRGHRGAIKVYSEPGQGTTFKALFPTVEGEAERPKKNEIEKPGWAGSGRILLVDDEAEVRQVAGHMLRHIGFDVVEAVDGREAVDRFREDPAGVDCVLLDLTMPRMGGEEAFRELRRIRRNVRVILSSGYNEQEVTQRFAGKGHAGFVQKPYTLARLLEALRALLGEKENQETVDQAKPKSKGGEPR